MQNEILKNEISLRQVSSSLKFSSSLDNQALRDLNTLYNMYRPFQLNKNYDWQGISYI